MEILNASITVGENAARHATIVYKAGSTVNLDSLLGQPLSYSYNVSGGGDSIGNSLFNGIILSANYSPENDTVTVSASDLRATVLGSLSNDEIDALIPAIIPTKENITGLGRIEKRLETAFGHAELDVNRNPRFTYYNKPSSVNLNGDSIICGSSGSNLSSPSGSIINNWVINAEYRYTVQRIRNIGFKWVAPERAFVRNLVADLRLPTYDSVADSFNSSDLSLKTLGVKYLPGPGLINLDTNNNKFLWYGDPQVKRVLGVGATFEDRWTQEVVEKFNIILSAPTSNIPTSKNSSSVSFTTDYSQAGKEWEVTDYKIDTVRVAPIKGSDTNPTLGAFLNSSGETKAKTGFVSITPQPSEDSDIAVRDYTKFYEAVNAEVEVARHKIKRSHRIGQFSIQAALNPSIDITSGANIAAGKASFSGDISSVTFNIDHVNSLATMNVSLLRSINSGGADIDLSAFSEFDLSSLPNENYTKIIEGGNHSHLGDDFSGRNGACYSKSDDFKLSTFDRDNPHEPPVEKPSFRDKVIARKEKAEGGKLSLQYTAPGNFQFVLSPDDVSKTLIEKYEAERFDENQTLGVKI